MWGVRTAVVWALVSKGSALFPSQIPIRGVEYGGGAMHSVGSSPSPRVAVVGGGLAGLAAASALCRRGFHVELFETRRRLGGRAGSFRDLRSGQWVDHCQHVAMGCCTNLAHWCRTLDLADCFRRGRRLHFIGPDGRASAFSAFPLLPAPLHLLPGLLRLRHLAPGERLRIVRTMGRLAALGEVDGRATVESWLRLQGESDRTIERFWSVVLTSALGERLDRVSPDAARKVFVDGLLASRRAYELEMPEVPLDEIFDRRAGAWLQMQGVAVHRGTRVRQVEADGGRVGAVVLADGSRRRFDFCIVAVPWRRVRSLFSASMLRELPSLDGVDRIESAPITAVHLWLDRAITPLQHAVLVGRLSQWLFRRGRAGAGGGSAEAGHYHQVVISASHALVGRDRRDVVRQVGDDLAAVFPAARSARLLRWRLITRRDAVLSMQPGVDRLRPAQQTAMSNLMLAGDWTATGWPSTMEGAVRSGYLAAEAVVRTAAPNAAQPLLMAELPRGALARWLIR